MKAAIYRSRGISVKYSQWAHDSLNRAGYTVEYGDGKTAQLSRGLDGVLILYESEIDQVREAAPEAASGNVPEQRDYNAIAALDSSGGAGVGQPDRIRWIKRSPPAFWASPSKEIPLHDAMVMLPGQSYIILCPERIKMLTMKLLRRMPELEDSTAEREIFRVLFWHELGHHYSWANLSPAAKVWFTDPKQRDLNMIEGFANWFALQMTSTLGRLIIAEQIIDQEACYIYYNVLRGGRPDDFLDALLRDGNLEKARHVFASMVGGLFVLGGGTNVFQKGFRGLIQAWEGTDGNFVSGATVTVLGPMKKGWFIAPRFEVVLGRFPPDAVVVANEVGEFVDYVGKKLPKNVILLSRTEHDVAAAFERNKSKSTEALLKSLISELRLIERLHPPETEEE